MFDTASDASTVPPEGAGDIGVGGSPDDSDPGHPSSETMTSGWLGVELDVATEHPGAMNDADLVDAIVGFDRMASWAAARQSVLLAEFARRRPVDHMLAGQSDKPCAMSPYAADEIALALRLSRGTAAIRLGQAQRLDEELPATREAWQAGLIDATKVRAVLDATANLHLDQHPELCTAVQDRVLGRAGGQTAGQLRAALARAVIAVDPAGAARRHQRARRDRRVAVNPDLDGMASLWALLPAPDALSAYEWLTRLARGMGAEDPRGMDARRADLLVALLTGRLSVAASDRPTGATAEVVARLGGVAAEQAGGLSSKVTEQTSGSGSGLTEDGYARDGKAGDHAAGEAVGQTGDRVAGEAEDGGPAEAPAERQPMPQPVNPGKPLVQIIIPFDTLTGAAEHPAELVGYGPIPAPLAREIAADAVWKRLVTDPLSGALLDHGRTTYRPPTALADHVRARDVHCRHPGCRRRAIDSELDHTVAYAGDGGRTAASNLYGACVHHHHLKHDAPGWSVAQQSDGLITWTTPTGHSYTSNPYDYRVDDEPELTVRMRPPRPHPTPPPPNTDPPPPS